MNRDQVKEVFKIVKSVYPHFEVNSEKVDIWARLLKDQDSSVVIRNTERYVTNNKFPPTIADLREVRLEAHSNDFLKKVEQWKDEASGKPRS